MTLTEIPQQNPTTNPMLDNLFRQKGELVTQLEIGQQKLQVVNNQIGQIISQQPPAK